MSKTYEVIFRITDEDGKVTEEDWRPTAYTEEGMCCPHDCLPMEWHEEGERCGWCDGEGDGGKYKPCLIVYCPMCNEWYREEDFRDHYMECGT